MKKLLIGATLLALSSVAAAKPVTATLTIGNGDSVGGLNLPGFSVGGGSIVFNMTGDITIDGGGNLTSLTLTQVGSVTGIDFLGTAAVTESLTISGYSVSLSGTSLTQTGGTMTDTLANCAPPACSLVLANFNAANIDSQFYFDGYAAGYMVGVINNPTAGPGPQPGISPTTGLPANGDGGVFSLIGDTPGGAAGAIFNAVQYASLSVVPVPAAVWLFGSALGLLGFRRKIKA